MSYFSLQNLQVKKFILFITIHLILSVQNYLVESICTTLIPDKNLNNCKAAQMSQQTILGLCIAFRKSFSTLKNSGEEILFIIMHENPFNVSFRDSLFMLSSSLKTITKNIKKQNKVCEWPKLKHFLHSECQFQPLKFR